MMFDKISSDYDFLNHFLSLGMDKCWRRKAIKILKKYKPRKILDIASGTGDFAFEALKLKPEKIIGIDISEKMINIAKNKAKNKDDNNLITFLVGDSENILYDDNSFDAIIVGFGVRNFENLNKGLSEINRVLKPGGVALILEFTTPDTFIIRQLYYFYFNFILPFIGKYFSKHNFAYTYLPETVKLFPSGSKFINIFEKSGFSGVNQVKLTFGITSIYTGFKM